MEAKKISFSFSKISKKLNLLPIKDHVKTDTKVELIKCLEGQEIKLVVEKIEEPPLTIPLKEAHKTSAALASLIKRRAVLLGEEEPEENNKKQTEASLSSSNDGHEDLEKRAARELLAETESNNSTGPSSKLVLPVVKPEDLPLDGAKESTLDEYESIPIQDFGKAMLRGMGWSEPPPKSNKKTGDALDDTPMVRPKGMGLGADKALNKKPLLVVPEANEVLEVKRNAYVCILSGKHKNLYGQIEGFDDYAGRVIVKMAIGGAKEAFNEFLCQPVSKKEYAQYGKCINNSKYEEYKNMENEHGQIVLNENEHTESQKWNRNDEDFKKIKSENNLYLSESSDRRDYNKYERKNRSRDDEYDRKIVSKRNEDVEYRIELNRDADRDHNRQSKREEDKNRKTKAEHSDKRHHRREYDDGKDYCRDDVKVPKRDERDRYEYKYDNQNSSSYRKSEDSYSRDCGKSPNRNRQRERNRKDTVETKTVELYDSSDSENDSYASKHKKSKKSKHSKKKLKKSKKSKSKYKNDSTDTETSSNDTSCESEEEKYKKHKKKTKKSKRQRERSPSRERR